MELKVHSQFIRSKRQQRAWSQEHLAHVSGLGIRTIQRIEGTGLASYESAKAIASVLEIPVAELVDQPAPANRSSIWGFARKRRIAIMISSILALMSFLAARTVVADQVMLDVGVTVNEENQTASQVITNEGEDAVIQIEDQYRLLISPTVGDNGDVFLAVRLLKSDGDEFVQIAQPRIVTPDGEQAVIRSVKEGGDSIYIKITPNVQ